MRWTSAGAKISRARMKPGACEHASLTDTTIVISSRIIVGEHDGYFGRTSRGVFDSMQLRAIITTGTKSPP